MALIAVSQNRRVADYLESVRRAGGDPVEVADTREAPEAIVSRVRGVMLTGGGDVDPALYGEVPHPTYAAAEPGRDFTQALLTDAESSATHPMTLTPAALAQYRDLLAAHLEALGTVAERAQAGYARLDTDDDVATFVTVELARRGLVRRR